MNTKHLMIPALLAALFASAPGFAQDHDRGDRGNWSQDNRGGDHRNGYQSRDGYQARGGGRAGDEGYGGGERHYDGAGPNHNWHRGDRLPSNYRSNQYVVNDWRGHHLRPPPRGYHWVQSGGDYVLAAVATGVIADLIINSH
jgi:Ni/Co efflux regulator RcnB